MAIDQSGVWRFRDLLPIVATSTTSSPCARATRRSTTCPAAPKLAGIDWLLAKHQGMNPTGSFKDTGMTAALSVAAERGFEWVACASTGNTSAAMAAYAARAGLRSIVFIPEGKIAWGKLSQSMDYGAITVQLKTDFDGCVRLLNELVRRSRSTCSTPSTPIASKARRPRRSRSSSRWSGRSPSTSSSPAATSPTLRAGQGLSGDEAPRPHPARARRSASSRPRAPTRSTAGSTTPTAR
jgi:threonine dehydratase